MAVLPPDPIFILRSVDMGPVNSISFDKNERLVSGTAKGTIHLWDLQVNRSTLHFVVGANPITSLHHLDDCLISQEKGGLIKCWSLTNSRYELKSSFISSHSAFCRTDFIPEINTLVFPKKDNEIGLLSLGDFKLEKIFTLDSETKSGQICSLKTININGQYYILAGFESGDLFIWDFRSCKVLNKFSFDEMILAIDYDEKTNRGICGGSGNKIFVFSYLSQTNEVHKKTEIILKSSGINCLRIRKDQKVFSSAGWDGRIRIFSWKSLRPLAVLTEHKNGSVMDICYSPGIVSMWKAPIMAAGGVDSQITLWDLYN